MKKYLKYLLFFIVILLPFAEWKFIGLPLRGRPILIDFNRYLSVSVFDLAFNVLAVFCIYIIWRTYTKKILFNWHLLWWGICIILIIVLLIQQKPALPYLAVTPVNVIDVRSLMIHFAMAVCVTAAVTQIPFGLIMRGAQLFYFLTAIGVAILCYFALTANVFFQFNYPFNTPSSIAFPFPNQNVAAIFMALCFIGAIGAIGVTVYRNMRVLLVLLAPIFLLAAALTGSRSNMFICCIMVLAYVIIYIIYYYNYTLAFIKNCKPSHPAILLISICIGFTLIFININWHPVRRSMSLFLVVWANPATLVTGGKDTARKELWEKAVGKKKFEDKSKTGSPSSKNITFSLGLTSVKDGCKYISNNIPGLKIGKPYYVRLTLTPSGTNPHLAVLNVFEDSQRQQLVGSKEMFFNAPQSANIYYFIADSDKRFVIMNAELSDFKKKSIEVYNSEFKRQTIQLFEEPFNGGAEPCISSAGNSIQINANTRLLRGYVTEPEKSYDSKNTLILEYTVNVKSAKHSIPFDPPVMFYVGLAESKYLVQKENDWRLIRNGLLIRHERFSTQWEKDVLFSHHVDKFYRWITAKGNKVHSGIDQVNAFNNEVSCGIEGQNLISRLWEPMVAQNRTSRVWEPVIADDLFYKTKRAVSEFEVPKGDVYKIKESDKNIRSLISAGPASDDTSWSADYNMDLRGSVHNVYLDWYYYVGPIPLGIFMILIISLLGVFAHFTWKTRFSKEFPFVLSILCQLLIIVALMYAHPYIWIKYIWFVFGLATAVMIHPDFKKDITSSRFL